MQKRTAAEGQHEWPPTAARPAPFTTYLGYTPREIWDAICFAEKRGWGAAPAHEPAPGDRYADRFDDTASLTLAAPADDGDGWVAIRTAEDGERSVHDVGAYALAEYYRYVPKA